VQSPVAEKEEQENRDENSNHSYDSGNLSVSAVRNPLVAFLLHHYFKIGTVIALTRVLTAKESSLVRIVIRGLGVVPLTCFGFVVKFSC